MLWEYTQLLFITAMVVTVLSFHKNTEKFGRIFYLLLGAVFWPAFAVSLLKIEYKWAGSTTVVSYTYIPSTESIGLVYGFGAIGLIMLIIGLLRVIELTYTPLVDYTQALSTKRDIVAANNEDWR